MFTATASGFSLDELESWVCSAKIRSDTTNSTKGRSVSTSGETIYLLITDLQAGLSQQLKVLLSSNPRVLFEGSSSMKDSHDSVLVFEKRETQAQVLRMPANFS